jgi:hypothetical protein
MLPNLSAGVIRVASHSGSYTQGGIRQAHKCGCEPPRRRPGGPNILGVPGRRPVPASVGQSCTWTNNNVAVCDVFIWDCDDDGVCVQGGTLWTDCYDQNGNRIPC